MPAMTMGLPDCRGNKLPLNDECGMTAHSAQDDNNVRKASQSSRRQTIAGVQFTQKSAARINKCARRFRFKISLPFVFEHYDCNVYREQNGAGAEQYRVHCAEGYLSSEQIEICVETVPYSR